MIVLASQSAARRRVLEAAGVAFVADPAAIDESRIKAKFRETGGSAEVCALALSRAKAEAVAPRHPDALVIGADQMLDCEGTWFDKPCDRAEARAQLLALRGRTHELVSALAIAGHPWSHVERARLRMRRFSDGFLDSYLAAMGEDVLATVGGYALEGVGAQLFERVDGDYFAILGLPLLPLLDFLRRQGALAA